MFSDGFCCKLTNQMLASWHIRMSRALQRRVWRLFTQQMKQGIDKKITKRWRWSIFRQLPLLFVLMVEIYPPLFFWLAKKKCSSVLSNTYDCIRNDTTNVLVQPDMESHLRWTLADLSNIMVLKSRVITLFLDTSARCHNFAELDAKLIWYPYM